VDREAKISRVSPHRPAPRAPWLPPGQVASERLHVVGERAAGPELPDLSRWRLEIGGLVETPLSLSWADYRALPAGERVVDVHCVTGWSHRAARFTGVPLATLLDRAAPRRDARFVRFEAYSSRGHDKSLPLEIARAETWLVHEKDGAPLAPEHGFPLRAVTGGRYFYKSLKWLRRVELLAEDRPGFWERTSHYHNGADPAPGDQRYASGSLSPGQIRLFLRAGRYDRWRGRLVLGVDLRAWAPPTRDLRGLVLKACDLRGVDLAGADLTGANLTRSDLCGADLRGAILRDADVEGACFAGADLRDADLRGAAATAVRLRAAGGGGARVEGLRWAGATGLSEADEAWLAEEMAAES